MEESEENNGNLQKYFYQRSHLVPYYVSFSSFCCC